MFVIAGGNPIAQMPTIVASFDASHWLHADEQCSLQAATNWGAEPVGNCQQLSMLWLAGRTR
jgi:hypothetical protein